MSGVWNKLSLDKKDRLLLAILLIIFVIVSRVSPHPPNFAPVAAIAIFSGAMLPRKLALILPLTAMVISDFFIGLHSLVFVTWGAFTLLTFLASYSLKKVNIINIIGVSLLGSVLFFLITNFAVWAEGSLYPRTFDGLIDCFVLAMPFFRNTVLGDLFYSGVIFGAYYFAVSTSQIIKDKLVKVN